MSDMKCPFCQQELVKDTPFAWNCPNEECVETDMMWGTANMWQELIRIRKALDVAVDALETFAQIPQPIAEVAKVKLYAIKEITALEQKDVK